MIFNIISLHEKVSYESILTLQRKENTDSCDTTGSSASVPDTLLSLAGVEQKVSGSLWSSRNGIALRNNTVLAVPSAHTHTQFNLRLWKQAPLQDVPSSVNYMSF